MLTTVSVTGTRASVVSAADALTASERIIVSANKNSIALNINGCSTKGAGSLTLVDGSFPAIAAEKNLAIRYKAKVSANEAVTNVNAATVIFTIAAVTDKEAA